MIKSNPKPKTCAWTGCENQFVPRFKSTEKFCSSQCAYNDHIKRRKEKQAKGEVKQYRIPKVSKKRSKENKIYTAKRIEFLSRKENQKCPVYPHLKTSQVHHMKGRIGKLYLDDRYWLAVSAEGHEWIEKNPEKAKEKGWSLNRLEVC